MTRQRWVSVCASLVLALFAVQNANAGVICVNAAGQGSGPCWANSVTYLRDALDAAGSGDEIWVATGTYLPTDKSCSVDGHCAWGSCGDGMCVWNDPREQSFVLRADVGVFGGFAGGEDPQTFDLDERDFVGDETILSGDLDDDDDDPGARETCNTHGDCASNGEACFDGYCVLRNSDYIDDNAYHVVLAPTTDDGTRLDGFTIRGGVSGTYQHGGGVRVTGTQSNIGHLDIANCKIRDNVVGQSSAGGGVFYNDYTTGTIQKTTVIHNYSAMDGGGIAVHSNEQDPFPTISDCEVVENVANMSGGGIKLGRLESGTEAAGLIINTLIEGNRAGTGGGAVGTKQSVTAEIRNCEILNNHAGSYGGAMWFEYTPTIKITNCVFAGNDANQFAAIYALRAELRNVTVTDNHNIVPTEGSTLKGIVALGGSNNLVTNSIIWGNTPSGDQLYLSGGSTTVRYSDIEDGEDNVHDPGGNLTWNIPPDTNIEGGDDPDFVDPTHPTAPDYSCKGISPVIDAGNNDDIPSGVTLDVAGKARKIDDPDKENVGNPTSGATVDMGAYEFNGPFSGPHGDNGSGTMNRYLSFVPGSSPTKQAVRVTYTGTVYTTILNESWWITEPFKVTEASCCNDSTPPPTFMAATTTCVDVASQVDPHYVNFSDWHGTCVTSECSGGKKEGRTCDSDADCLDVLYIYAPEILPDGEYEIDLIAEEKDYTVGDNFTEVPLVVTSIFGDVVGDCGPRPCTPPQGIVDFVDLFAVVEKFRNLPAAGRKARFDVVNSDVSQTVPDQKIDFVDISAIVSTFKHQIPVPPLPEPEACP